MSRALGAGTAGAGADDALERLMAATREVAAEDREEIHAGPLTGYVDHVRVLKWFSFAVPDPGADAAAVAAALPALVEAFRAHDRTARVELFEELTPELPGVLEAAGWSRSERMPVMACTPATLLRAPVPPGVEVVAVGAKAPAALLCEFQAVQRAAFADDEPVTDQHVERMRRRAAESFYAAARCGGAVVGTAAGTPVRLGTAEVGGVATDPAARGRGIASTLTAAIADAAFGAGADLVWLTAADAAAQRLYARAGFSVIGTQSAYDA